MTQDTSGPRPPYVPGRAAAVPPWQGPPATVAHPSSTGLSGVFRRLGPGQRAAVYLGVGLVASLLLCCGGTAVVGAFTEPPGHTGPLPTDRPAQAPPATRAPTADASTAAPTAPATTAAPVVETRTVTETRAIAHDTREVKDPDLAKGKRKVRAKGADGVMTLTYEVTYTDGVETDRRLLSEEVARAPVTRVVAVGTKKQPSSNCHPSYRGVCVPIASDVDCAGGSGNGPAYVQGPLRVVGPDVYDLDRDADGIACDT